MKQYNMLSACNRKMHAGWLETMMRRIGVKRDCITPVIVSSEVKKLLLGKLIEIKKTNTLSGAEGEGLSWKIFDGKWTRRWASNANTSSAAQRAIEVSKIQGSTFVSSVYLWHLVTDICLVDDDRTCSLLQIFCQELSNYTMYLVAKCDATLDSSGYDWLKCSRDGLLHALSRHSGDPKEFIHGVRNGISTNAASGLELAHHVSLELLKPEAAADRWELIATVWVEMLCYIALNCGAEFHAKSLIDGGEFVSHVKIVLFILGFCFS
uniref:Uncharacterized protein n=1 Tax=Avena sativa TaxID=4498 RepID=A0ACD5XJL1_AVESA